MIIYQCDPKRNQVCSKTHCGWLKNGTAVCFGTSHEEYAALDENGVPIVTGIVKIEGSDSE